MGDSLNRIVGTKMVFLTKLENLEISPLYPYILIYYAFYSTVITVYK